MGKPEIKRKDLIYPELSYLIVGCAFDVYNELGPGHSESVYQKALAIAFANKKISFKEQLYLPLKFNGVLVEKKFFDFLVEDKIVVEIKKGIHFSKKNIDQVLGYLERSNLKLAILINFGHEGVTFKRLININAK